MDDNPDRHVVCPCGGTMELMHMFNWYRYACRCGWESPVKVEPDAAYRAAIRRKVVDNNDEQAKEINADNR